MTTTRMIIFLRQKRFLLLNNKLKLWITLSNKNTKRILKPRKKQKIICLMMMMEKMSMFHKPLKKAKINSTNCMINNIRISNKNMIIMVIITTKKKNMFRKQLKNTLLSSNINNLSKKFQCNLLSSKLILVQIIILLSNQLN